MMPISHTIYHHTPPATSLGELLSSKQKEEARNLILFYERIPLNRPNFENPNESDIEKAEHIKAWLNHPNNHILLQTCEYLELNNLQLRAVPEEIGLFTHIKFLDLSDNHLATLPDQIGKLTKLKHFTVANNYLMMLPPDIKKLKELELLTLNNNMLMSLPKEVEELTALRELGVRKNQISSLPDTIANLKALRFLDLSKNKLSALPRAIKRLTLLEHLDLRKNEITTLPKEIKDLKKLRSLLLDHNKLSTIPREIGALGALENLSLNSNQIETLPESIERLPLICLHLENNKLLNLPQAIRNLPLQKLTLKGNPLQILPLWIKDLKALQCLSLNHVLLPFLLKIYQHNKRIQECSLTSTTSAITRLKIEEKTQNSNHDSNLQIIQVGDRVIHFKMFIQALSYLEEEGLATIENINKMIDSKKGYLIAAKEIKENHQRMNDINTIFPTFIKASLVLFRCASELEKKETVINLKKIGYYFNYSSYAAAYFHLNQLYGSELLNQHSPKILIPVLLQLSEKFLEDLRPYNESITKQLQIPVQEFNQVELECLQALNYNLAINPSEYEKSLTFLQDFKKRNDPK